MNRVWRTRRTKQGLAARQYASAQRRLRRLRKAKAPLPYVVVVKGVQCTLTVSVGKRIEPVCDYEFDWRPEYDLDEEW